MLIYLSGSVAGVKEMKQKKVMQWKAVGRRKKAAENYQEGWISTTCTMPKEEEKEKEDTNFLLTNSSLIQKKKLNTKKYIYKINTNLSSMKTLLL